ncbi:unnamed protein product [Rhizoctonia solani]|uniref:Uncharacterized protein n=1 Tax=Rhizoctonia solani TaxID=456999 RepID=A0A8H3HMD2_9AGAM|nr:unnamed protein product [Rhizoctonia solani]
MSLPDGIYKIFTINNYRLAFYGYEHVQVNDSSNVTVEIKNETGGQRIRFNDKSVNPSTSDWFGYSTNLQSDNRVIQASEKQGLTGDNLLWAITPAGGLFHIKIWNADFAWTVPENAGNSSDIFLEPSRGSPGQQWQIVPA